MNSGERLTTERAAGSELTDFAWEKAADDSNKRMEKVQSLINNCFVMGISGALRMQITNVDL